MMNIRKNPKTGSEENADKYVLKYNEKGKCARISCFNPVRK
jgi:hypothetical protein